MSNSAQKNKKKQSKTKAKEKITGKVSWCYIYQPFSISFEFCSCTYCAHTVFFEVDCCRISNSIASWKKFTFHESLRDITHEQELYTFFAHRQNKPYVSNFHWENKGPSIPYIKDHTRSPRQRSH